MSTPDIVSKIATIAKDALELAASVELAIKQVNGKFSALQESKCPTKMIKGSNAGISAHEVEQEAIILLIEHAKETFAVGTKKPDITYLQIPDHLRSETLEGTAALTDYPGCWNWIESTHGGDRGVARAREEAAKEIKRHIDQVKESKSGVTFKVDAYLERLSFNNRRQYSYRSIERVLEFVTALTVASQWMREDAPEDAANLLLQCLESLSGTISEYGRDLTLGESTIIPMAGNHLQIIPRSSAVELKMSHQTAARLQAFLALHPDANEHAA
jgi:hypothetical protein